MESLEISTIRGLIPEDDNELDNVSSAHEDGSYDDTDENAPINRLVYEDQLELDLPEITERIFSRKNSATEILETIGDELFDHPELKEQLLKDKINTCKPFGSIQLQDGQYPIDNLAFTKPMRIVGLNQTVLKVEGWITIQNLTGKITDKSAKVHSGAKFEIIKEAVYLENISINWAIKQKEDNVLFVLS